MPKDEKKADKPSEQAPEVTPVLPTAAEVQAELDHVASFQALVQAGGPALDKIAAGWAQVLDGIAECDSLQQDQKAAVSLAKEHAAQHGTTSHAVELGHHPLVAHSWDRVSKLKPPAVPMPEGYVRTFSNEHDRMTSTQALLNQGSTLVAPHAPREQVHEALLSGVKPSDIQSARVPVEKLNQQAKGWFGYRPDSKSQ